MSDRLPRSGKVASSGSARGRGHSRQRHQSDSYDLYARSEDLKRKHRPKSGKAAPSHYISSMPVASAKSGPNLKLIGLAALAAIALIAILFASGVLGTSAGPESTEEDLDVVDAPTLVGNYTPSIESMNAIPTASGKIETFDLSDAPHKTQSYEVVASSSSSDSSNSQKGSSNSSSNGSSSEGSNSEAHNDEMIVEVPSAEEASEDGSEFEATSDAGEVEISLSQEVIDSLNQEISNFTNKNETVGFLLLNMESGRGVAYNTDEIVYGASSIKAPYCTYVCQELIDNGDLKLSSSCPQLTDAGKKKGKTSVKALIKDTIVNSSNGSFGGMFENLGSTASYKSWLQSLNVSGSIHKRGEWFAYYSPRDAAKLWLNTYDYTQNDSEAAQYLKDQLNNTTVSFIRDGVVTMDDDLYSTITWPEEVHDSAQLLSNVVTQLQDLKSTLSDYQEVTVWNKAGWCVTGSKKNKDLYDSVCDNGIIEDANGRYLMCIMSSAPYSESNARSLSSIASSLYEHLYELEA